MRKKSILLIDDEEILLLGLCHELKKAGYEVVGARDGLEGSRILKSSDFDLVITDLMMEGVNGIEILRQALEKLPRTGVIIMTGYGSPQAIAEVWREEGCDYMFKPCDRGEFLWKVARCLREQEQARKIDRYERLLGVCPICKRINAGTAVEHRPGVRVDLESFFSKTPGLDSLAKKCDECGGAI